MMKTILIVDDSESDQFYNEVVITTHNQDIKIIKAYDGQEALECINKYPDDEIDLILLDINMPRMNGHDFLKAYSQNGTREIPVVVMLTSSDQDVDKEKAFKHKCVKDYLLKPISEETLKELDALVSRVMA